MKKKLKAPPEMPFSKEKQLASKYRDRETVIPGKNPKKVKLNIKEDALQKQCNDVLNAYRIRYVRLEDWVWLWVKKNAPMKLVNYLSRCFGGMPDNVIFLPLGDKYNLALMLELKSEKGVIRGKQKHWQKELQVQLSRDPDTTLKIIREFMKDAEAIDKIVKEYFKQKEEKECQK